MNATSTRPVCQCHGAPVGDGGTLCAEGTDEARELLRWLTADVSRSDREPERLTIEVRHPDGTVDVCEVIRPGSCGRMPSTIWDTPSGEMRHLERILAESSARLAVRVNHAKIPAQRAEVTLPLDLDAVDDARAIRIVVGRWAARLSGRDVPADLDGRSWDVAEVAAWLIDELLVIRRHDWAGEMLIELRRVVERAVRRVDVAPERVYLGVCGSPSRWLLPDGVEGPTGPPCDGQVFATRGLLDGRCRTCRAEHDVVPRQQAQADRLRAVRLTAADIERVTAGLGRRIRRNTVTQWAGRGRLEADDQGRYLVAAVLDLAERAEARRTGRGE